MRVEESYSRIRLWREGENALQRVEWSPVTTSLVAGFYVGISGSRVAGEEHATRSADILLDYCGNLPLDVTELISHPFTRGVRHVYAPLSETRWQQEELLILYELPHMKDDVPAVHPIVCIQLLHAGKLSCVGAREAASAASSLLFEGACLGGEAGESSIESRLDVVIVFLLSTPRVEIKDARMPRVHDYEGAVRVSAQNKPSSSD